MRNHDGNDNLIAVLASTRRGKPALERRVAELALGVVSALRAGELPVDRAWDELFSLDHYRELRRRRLSPRLSELFELGLELENVAEVAPGSLNESYDRMENLAQQVIRSSSQPRPRLRKSA